MKAKDIPRVVCLLVFLGILSFVLFDMKAAKALFHDFTDWIRDHPVEAIFGVVLFYTVSVVSLLPTIMLTHFTMGYVYA